MGQQSCCACNNRIPNLEEDLKISNLEIIQQVNEIRLQHKVELRDAKVYHFGDAIFRGKVNKQRKKQGYGEYYTQTSVFMGIFENDEPNGHGLALKDDSNYYRGNFKDGQFEGYGKEYGPNFTFEGYFQQGSRKKGIFKNDLFEYHGEFEDNTFHGQGLIIFQKGVKYQGSFRQGKMNGEGVAVFPNNKIFRGVMENDRCKEGKFQWIVEPIQNKPSKFCIHIFDDQHDGGTGKSITTPTTGSKDAPTPRSHRESVRATSA